MNTLLAAAPTDDREAEATQVERWCHLVEYPIALTWDLSGREAYHLKEAIPIGLVKNAPSDLHEEELSDMTTRLAQTLPALENGWFCRFAQMSPKDGMHGSRALMSARMVVEQLATSARALCALKEGARRLYFCRFDPTWQPDCELRGFVFNGRLTALSQYSRASLYFAALPDDALRKIFRAAQEKIESLRDGILGTMGLTHVVCDLLWRHDKERVQVIEFNPFARPTGSAFFNWETDRAILRGDGTHPVFRVSD